MKDIIITNANGEQINISMVRFFRLNGIEYLIFSLNEIDEGGYVKLYVSKIVENIGKTIEDDVEWNLVKDTIKTIIKSNKDNLPLPITDLDTTKINNLKIVDQKIFKLNDSLLQLLTANKNEEVSVVDNQQINLQENVVNKTLEEVTFEPNNVNNQPSVDVSNSITTDYVENQNLTTFYGTEEFNAFNNPVDVDAQTDEYALDYKVLYDNELKKNEDLTNEVERYRNIIDNLKKIINQDI